MLPKPGKDLYKLCIENLAANVCSTDPRPQPSTVLSAYMHSEGVVDRVGHPSTDPLLDEDDSSFVGSVMTRDDASDDIALPPSSSSPPDFASSSPRPDSKGSTASKTSASSTPSAFFSLRDGQYLLSGDKRESPDNFTRRLNDAQEYSEESGSADIAEFSQQRGSSTLQIAHAPHLAPSYSRIFSRISSPNASNLSNSHSSFENYNDRYDFRNVRLTEPDLRSRQVFVSTYLQGFPQTPDSGQETNISPITFRPNYGLQESWVVKLWSELHSSSDYRSFVDKSACGERPFRIIKRAQSYVPLATEDGTEPAWKRPKIHHPSYSHQARRVYAYRNASLRRADSLKCTVDHDLPRQFRVELTESRSILKLMVSSQHGDEASQMIPNSPCLYEVGKPYRPKTRSTKGLEMAVPIVAPPADHITGMSINSETLAKLRLKRYLEREWDLTLADGLPSDPLFYQGRKAGHQAFTDNTSEVSVMQSRDLWEVALGIGKEKRLSVIDWILGVGSFRFRD